MNTPTTVRTSATKALAEWKAAQNKVFNAGLDHANRHTAATKRALREAQDEERKALKNYFQSRTSVYTAILNGTIGKSKRTP